MKKRGSLNMLFLFLLVASAGAGFAQNRPALVVKGGISIPNLTASNSSDPVSTGYGSRLSPDAAVGIRLPVTERFSIQPEIEYSSQGGKKSGTQAFVTPADMAALFPQGQVPTYLYADYKSEARLNYLLLPLLARFQLLARRRWEGYFAMGPFASYLLQGRNITSGSSFIYLDKNKTQPLSPSSQSFDSNDNITSDLHRFNAGISGHAGLIYTSATWGLFVEAGGNYGIIDIQKSAANGKNKTGAFIVDLGLELNL